MVSAQLNQADAFDADQVEVRAIMDGVASVISASMDEMISGEAADVGDELRLAKLPFNQDESLGSEEITGRALNAIAHRQRHLGTLYPFTVERSKLTYEASANGVYEFCLATCLASSEHSKEFQQLLRHFERIALELVRLHIGGKSIGVRFGFPSEKDWDGAPTRFPRKVDWMRNVCRFHDAEWILKEKSPIKELIARQKDARIDFVIRTPMLDTRCGSLTFLGQCGCGKGDVDESSRKSEEMTTEWLHFLFSELSVVKPVKVFATSHHFPNDDQLFIKQGASQSLLIDRIRITLMAQEYWGLMDAQYRDRIPALTSRVF